MVVKFQSGQQEIHKLISMLNEKIFNLLHTSNLRFHSPNLEMENLTTATSFTKGNKASQHLKSDMASLCACAIKITNRRKVIFTPLRNLLRHLLDISLSVFYHSQIGSGGFHLIARIKNNT